jgi:hypothetical protein
MAAEDTSIRRGRVGPSILHMLPALFANLLPSGAGAIALRVPTAETLTAKATHPAQPSTTTETREA